MIACHRHILGCQKFWTAAWRGPIPHVRRILRLQDKKIKESDKKKEKRKIRTPKFEVSQVYNLPSSILGYS